MTLPSDLDHEILALIRRIARTLARGDSHLADDLEQETILTALRDQPKNARFMEPWLRRIVRNRLFTHRVREARARRHEDVTVASGIAPVTGEGDAAYAIANGELRRELRRRVFALPEIYRVVVQMRILDGRPLKEVAEALGLPVETVRTRLRRGLARLRTEIGSKDRWASLRTSWAALAFVKRKKTVASLGLVTVMGFAVTIQPPELTQSAAIAHSLDDVAEVVLDRQAVLARAPTGRELIGGSVFEEEGAGHSPGDAERPWEREVLVQVVDELGAPAPGVDVFARWTSEPFGARLLGETDEGGKLRMPVAMDRCWLAARGVPGQLSDSICLDQPRFEGGAPVRLQLQERHVAWIQVAGADADARDLVVQLWPSDVRQMIRVRHDAGLVGSSCWVPAWAQEGQRYGLAWGNLRSCIVVGRGGESLWWGPLMARQDEAPEAIDLREAWEVTGRVVTSDGLPVEGYPVFVPSHSPGLRRHGQSTRTGSGGQFRVGAISAETASVTIGRDLRLRAEKPEDGTGLRSVDLGHIDIGRLDVDQETRVTLTGFNGRVQVAAIHLDELKLWGGYRLAHPVCRLIGGSGDLVSTGSVRIRESSEDLASIVVTGIDPQSGETVRLFHSKARKKALPQDVLIEGPLPALSFITLENPVPDRAGRLLLVERRSGFRRSVAIPPRASDEAERPIRIPISPGLWDLLYHSPDGRVLVQQAVRLDPGKTMDFGVFAGAAGTVHFDWTGVEADGGPSDSVQVRLMRDSEVIADEIVERARLSELWAIRREIPGAYRICARASGVVHSGFTEVADQGQTTVTLTKGAIVLEVRVRMKGRSAGFPSGTLELFDAAGDLIERVSVKANPGSRRHRMMVPMHQGLRVVGNFNGRSFEGVVDVDNRPGFGSVTLRAKMPTSKR